MSFLFGGDELGRLIAGDSLTHVSNAQVLGKSLNQGVKDEDNEIFGFIPNPGNTVATVFGVPVGTQFGTAVGVEGWGGLILDIVTDPTIWLSVGAMFVPGGQVAGAAGLSARLGSKAAEQTLKKSAVRMGRLRSLKKFLGGLTPSEKSAQMSNLFETAFKSVENPQLAREIQEGLISGDHKKIFSSLDAMKELGINTKRIKLDATTFLDADKIVGKTARRNMEDSFKLADEFGEAVLTDDLFKTILNKETGFEFVGPKFLKSGVEVLNKLPGADKAAQAAAVVGQTYAGTISKITQFTGIDDLAKGVMDSAYKYTTTFSLGRSLAKGGEVVPQLMFLNNDTVTKVALDIQGNSSKGSSTLLNPKRIFKSEADFLEGMPSASAVVDGVQTSGETSSELARMMLQATMKAEQMASGKSMALLNIFGLKNSGYNKKMGDLILNNIPFGVGKQRLERQMNFGILSKLDDVVYEDQVRSLWVKQATGKWLHELPDHIATLDDAGLEALSKDLPGFNRVFDLVDEAGGAAKFAEKFAPKKQTGEAYTVLNQQVAAMGKDMEASGIMSYEVTDTFDFLSREQIRSIRPDKPFQMRGVNPDGTVKFVPLSGYEAGEALSKSPDKALNFHIGEAARDRMATMFRTGEFEQAFEASGKTVSRGQFKEETFRRLTQDPTIRGQAAKNHGLLNSYHVLGMHGSTNFHREIGVAGYKGDPLSIGWKAKDSIDSLHAYFAGASKAVVDQSLFKPEILEEMFKRIGAEYTAATGQAGEKAANTARQAMVHRNLDHIKADSVWWKVSAAANKFQIITKLTAGMSALTNLGQTALNVPTAGLRATMVGMSDAWKALQKGLPDSVDELGVLQHDMAKDFFNSTKEFGGTTSRFLELYGFSSAERWNRRMTANVGSMMIDGFENAATGKWINKGYSDRYPSVMKATAGRFKQGGKVKTDRLVKFLERARFAPNREAAARMEGVTGTRSIDEVMDLIKNKEFQGFNQAERDLISTEWVNTHQFRLDPTNVPVIFQHPLTSFAGIFMKFQFKAQEFYRKEVITPGVEYIASRGKKGDIIPLLLTLSPLGPLLIGEVIADVKSFLNDRERPEDIADRLWDDYMGIAALGLTGQVLDSQGNPFKEKALRGANVNDLIKYTKSLGIAVTEGEDDQFWDEVLKDITHPLPLQLRSAPRNFLRDLKSPEEIQKRATQREAKGLVEGLLRDREFDK